MARMEGDFGWLCEAACTYTPLSDEQVGFLESSFPGVQFLALALAHHNDALVQVLFAVSPLKGPCVGKPQVFRSASTTLGGAVVKRGVGFTGSLRRMPAFPDAAVHCINGYTNGSLACVPLRNARTGRPFGSVTVSFLRSTDAASSKPAINALAAAISCDACEKQLQEFASIVVDVISFHPSPPPPDWMAPVEASESSDDDCCLDSSVNLAPHPLWLTFPDADLEAAFVRWQARHLRFFDPVGAMSCFFFLFHIGSCPRYAGWERHPAVLTMGWLNLAPIMLSATPWTSAFFIAHRELLVTSFQVGSICWHMATGNGTAIMPAQLYAAWGHPLWSCYCWMGVNLFMFQLRWWKAVLLGAAMLIFNVVPLATSLCATLEVPVDGCLRRSLITAGATIGVILLLMRLSELS